MKTYELITITGSTGDLQSLKAITEEGVVFWIPLDPANSDYAEYLRYTEWVEAGNSPEDFWVAKGNESEIIENKVE